MRVNFQRTNIRLLIILSGLFFPLISIAQQNNSDSLQSASLDKVVDYALTHQPVIKQAEVDEEITNKVIKGKLADWYPQINFTYNYQRFIDLQSSVLEVMLCVSVLTILPPHNLQLPRTFSIAMLCWQALRRLK